MEYLIRSDYEQDYRTREFLFWSKEDGWVDRTYADTFTENEKKYFSLPATGEWVEVQ